MVRFLANVVLPVAALLILATFSTAKVAAADWCDMPEGQSMETDRLTIGEFGMFASDARCPPLEDHLGLRFRYPKRDLHVVMRLEGRNGYLSRERAREPITVRLKKEGEDRTHSSFLDIGNPNIDIEATSSESKTKGNYFDWRFDVKFNTIIRPGTYTLTLRQGGEQICLTNGMCQIVFDIL